MVRPNILHQEYYPWIRGCTLHRKQDFFIDTEFIFFCLSNDGFPLWQVEINTDLKNYFWCTIITLNTTIEVKRPMIPLSRLQRNGGADHKRIWTPCVFRISLHVKQRLETFSSSSLARLRVHLFFFLFTPSCHPSALFFIWYLSSEPNTHNAVFQDCLRHGCPDSSVSIFLYFFWDGLWSIYTLRNRSQLSKTFPSDLFSDVLALMTRI